MSNNAHFDFKNIIKVPTCFQSIDNPSSIDVILTNRSKSFMHSKSVTCGLSDHHSLVCTMFRAHISILKPIEVNYRCFRKFDELAFLADLESAISNTNFGELANGYAHFSKIFDNVANIHAPMKKKFLRGNNAPFVTNEMRKAIRHRSKLRNKARRDKTAASELAYRKQRNKCTQLKRNSIKSYFQKLTENGRHISKRLWDTIKPFMSGNGSHGQEEFLLDENSTLIKDHKTIANIFNEYYTNIVEYATGHPPVHVPLTPDGDNIAEILNHYADHSSIKEIKNTQQNHSFELSFAEEDAIREIIGKLDISKATGIDNNPPRLVKLSANVIAKPLTDIINHSISSSVFPDEMKVAKIAPIYKNPKEGSRLSKVFFRPVSVLVTFSKIYERYIHNEMNGFVESVLSEKMSAYRTGYSCQHVLLDFTEKIRHHLDQNSVVGAVLMDLSKAFDCLPHELLIAKLAAYGVQDRTLRLLYSYLKNRRQSVNIKGKLSKFLSILAGVPQGSILGPILFNIFLNDFIFIFDNSNIFNFADDNTLTAIGKTIPSVVQCLENDSRKAISWLDANHMIANPGKFKGIIFQKGNNDTSGIDMNINDKVIKSSTDVTLLGISIDCQLSLRKHISKLCKQAGNQLNALKRFHTYLTPDIKAQFAKTFVLSNFNYCPIVWHFCGNGDMHKIEKLNERVIRFMYNDYTSDYLTLLEVNGECSLYLKRIRIIAQEVYKTIHGLSPEYTKELLKNRTFKSRRPLDLYIPKVNQVTYGFRSYRFEAPTVWNSLPLDIRRAENFPLFKKLIGSWTGPNCRCNSCNFYPSDENT